MKNKIVINNSKRLKYYLSAHINKNPNHRQLLAEIFKNVSEFDISRDPEDLEFYVLNYIDKKLYKQHSKKDKPKINEFLNPVYEEPKTLSKFQFEDKELYLDFDSQEIYQISDDEYINTGKLKKTTLKNADVKNDSNYFRIILDYNLFF